MFLRAVAVFMFPGLHPTWFDLSGWLPLNFSSFGFFFFPCLNFVYMMYLISFKRNIFIGDWEKNPLPHCGIEPESVLRLAVQSDVLYPLSHLATWWVF